MALLQEHVAAEARRQQEQQQPPQPQQAVQSQPDQPRAQQAQQPSHTPTQQQQHEQQQQDPSAGRAQPAPSQGSGSSELQLASFKRLRHTVNARDLYRRTPLIVAAKQGHLECAHLLVDAASNLFAVDREGNT